MSGKKSTWNVHVYLIWLWHQGCPGKTCGKGVCHFQKPIWNTSQVHCWLKFAWVMFEHAVPEREIHNQWFALHLQNVETSTSELCWQEMMTPNVKLPEFNYKLSCLWKGSGATGWTSRRNQEGRAGWNPLSVSLVIEQDPELGQQLSRSRSVLWQKLTIYITQNYFIGDPCFCNCEQICVSCTILDDFLSDLHGIQSHEKH